MNEIYEVIASLESEPVLKRRLGLFHNQCSAVQAIREHIINFHYYAGTPSCRGISETLNNFGIVVCENEKGAVITYRLSKVEVK